MACWPSRARGQGRRVGRSLKPMRHMTSLTSKKPHLPLPLPVTSFNFPHFHLSLLLGLRINSGPWPSAGVMIMRLSLGDQSTLEHACPCPHHTSGRSRCPTALSCYQLNHSGALGSWEAEGDRTGAHCVLWIVV